MDTKYIPKGPYSKRILATLNLFALVNSILYCINEPGGVHRYHEGGLCLTLPQELHVPVLEECHDLIATGGHQGTDKTYLKLRRRRGGEEEEKRKRKRRGREEVLVA
jgi:hypothetical protein